MVFNGLKMVGGIVRVFFFGDKGEVFLFCWDLILSFFVFVEGGLVMG